MTENSKKPVLNNRYELSGNTLPRQIMFWVRMKTSIMGNFDSGPGLKNLVLLWLIHYIGKPVFWCRTRLRNQHRLKQAIKSLVGRNSNK